MGAIKVLQSHRALPCVFTRASEGFPHSFFSMWSSKCSLLSPAVTKTEMFHQSESETNTSSWRLFGFCSQEAFLFRVIQHLRSQMKSLLSWSCSHTITPPHQLLGGSQDRRRDAEGKGIGSTFDVFYLEKFCLMVLKRPWSRHSARLLLSKWSSWQLQKQRHMSGMWWAQFGWVTTLTEKSVPSEWRV